jgi:hypothetical protein
LDEEEQKIDHVSDSKEDEAEEDTSAEEVEDSKKEDSSFPYKIELSGIRLKDEFAKAFFLYVRAKMKKWEYQDQLMSWQPEVVTRALKDYKKLMLDIVLGSTHGNLEVHGLLANPGFLRLEDVYRSLKQQKIGDSRDVPSILRKQVDTYVQMVFPFEKRIIFDLFQAGFVSTKGEFLNLDKAIHFLNLRGAQQYKSEEEKELDADVEDTQLTKEMGEEEDI